MSVWSKTTKDTSPTQKTTFALSQRGLCVKIVKSAEKKNNWRINKNTREVQLIYKLQLLVDIKSLQHEIISGIQTYISLSKWITYVLISLLTQEAPVSMPKDGTDLYK